MFVLYGSALLSPLLIFLNAFFKLVGILDRGIQIDGLGMKSFQTYESNIVFALRFMVDRDIVGGNWIEVPTGKYKKNARTLSYCQLEFHCLYPHLRSLSFFFETRICLSSNRFYFMSLLSLTWILGTQI